MFAHGISPLKDMLINLNMTSVMIWPRSVVCPAHLSHLMPRYNEGVKVALATRQAEVVEMYQPMTELMRQCQDAITECMEAMLVELKRDHTLVSHLVRCARRIFRPEPRPGRPQREECPVQELRHDGQDATQAGVA